MSQDQRTLLGGKGSGISSTTTTTPATIIPSTITHAEQQAHRRASNQQQQGASYHYYYYNSSYRRNINFTSTTNGTSIQYTVNTDTSLRRRRRQQHNNNFATLSDVWLCMACALGWAVWFVSSTRPEHSELLRYQTESSHRVIGHVLQVSVGHDPDGTGIPMYNAVIDYVVQGTADDDDVKKPMIQVRKCFQTRYLLQEGFANIELLVLAQDPTISVLLDDYYRFQNVTMTHNSNTPTMDHGIALLLPRMGFPLS
jgi:hypothetical protein